MNKLCSTILLLVAVAFCNIEQASALRGNSVRANDLHRNERISRRRRLKKGGPEPYEQVAAHEGGLFGAVKKVAKKAKEKKEAVEAAVVAASTNATSNATISLSGVPANETLPRDLPVFSLKFFTTSDFNPADDPNNYDELEAHLGQYLEERMNELFNETPAELLFTELYVDETEDPFIVDVYATVNFKIPGQAPTHDFLVQQTKLAFTVQEDPDEYENDFEYLLELVRSMNTTNPFHKTVEIAYNPWEKTPTKTSSDNSSRYWETVFSLLGITAFLSLVIVLLHIFKKYRDSQYVIHDDPLELHHVEPRSGINGMSYSDEESLRHLDAVRKQYSESNNLPAISLVDPQLEPSGSYEAPIFVGYRDDVEEEEEGSQDSDEYTEQVIEDDEEEVSVEETVEEEFMDEPQEPESNLGRFERLIGNLRGNESDEEETVEEEIIEDDEEESYDEQTVESEDLLNLGSVPVQLESTERSQPVDPPQEEAEVATKDLFSMWENGGNKRTSAPVESLNNNTTEDSAAAQEPPAQERSGLFSFWAIKAGESKDDDESAKQEAVETNDDDDESTEEHTLI